MGSVNNAEIGKLYVRVEGIKKQIKVRECEIEHLIDTLRILADCLDPNIENKQIEAIEGDMFFHTHPRKHTTEVTHDPHLEFPTQAINIVSDFYEKQAELQKLEGLLAAKVACAHT